MLRFTHCVRLAPGLRIPAFVHGGRYWVAVDHVARIYDLPEQQGRDIAWITDGREHNQVIKLAACLRLLCACALVQCPLPFDGCWLDTLEQAKLNAELKVIQRKLLERNTLISQVKRVEYIRGELLAGMHELDPLSPLIGEFDRVISECDAHIAQYN